jgi:septal ring factor EnvC (AmiA/AmiB activator)
MTRGVVMPFSHLDRDREREQSRLVATPIQVSFGSAITMGLLSVAAVLFLTGIFLQSDGHHAESAKDRSSLHGSIDALNESVKVNRRDIDRLAGDIKELTDDVEVLRGKLRGKADMPQVVIPMDPPK